VTTLHQITIVGRIFCIAAILGLGLVARDAQVILSLVIVAAVATTAIYVSLATPLATAIVVSVEAAIIGLIIGLALPGAVVFLPYLVVLSLIAGIARGVVGVSAVIVIQFVAIGLVLFAWAPDVNRQELSRALSPWLLTSIGAGLLGVSLGKQGRSREGVRDTSYEYAHRLLTQLRTVARRLSSGLDPATIAIHICDDVVARLSADHAAVYVRTDGGVMSPLAYSTEDAREIFTPALREMETCWTKAEPILTADGEFGPKTAALPLRVGARMIGVVLAELPGSSRSAPLKELMGKLDDHSLRLDTALAFDEIRSIATLEERRRLAREIHDGVAQEIASLGYNVDDLMAAAASDEHRAALGSLRQELTRVVTELRLSIFDLRSEILVETGLGTALSEYVRHVGSRSAMTVHLSLDEGPTRLRTETEIELLRIAQEAIVNARKHSGAENLWVTCTVRPPFAQLEIRDDGSGGWQSRPDSYGLRIMKERAQRLNARLDIEGIADRSATGQGAVIKVTLGDPSDAVTEAER
jgi:signal transduction histidine kinase